MGRTKGYIAQGFPARPCRMQPVMLSHVIPDSKVHGANMGSTWVLWAPDGPHVGPMNLVNRDVSQVKCLYSSLISGERQFVQFASRLIYFEGLEVPVLDHFPLSPLLSSLRCLDWLVISVPRGLTSPQLTEISNQWIIPDNLGSGWKSHCGREGGLTQSATTFCKFRPVWCDIWLDGFMYVEIALYSLSSNLAYMIGTKPKGQK